MNHWGNTTIDIAQSNEVSEETIMSNNKNDNNAPMMENKSSEEIKLPSNNSPTPTAPTTVEPTIKPSDNKKVKNDVVTPSPIPTSTPNNTKAPIGNVSEQPAKDTTSSNPVTTPISTIAPTPSSTPKVVSTNIYKDGTFVGVGRGYNPNVKVAVTIKNDKITNIQITSDHETPSYSDLPFSLIPRAIIAAQSLNVDTVAGATRTSEGIKEAVADALDKARI